MAKKQLSTSEINQMIQSLKPGEVKHFPKQDMTISKPLHTLPTGNSAWMGASPKRSKLIPKPR